MANEIYNKTWWGDAIKTANAVNDKPDLFNSQSEMKQRVDSDGGVYEAQLCVSNEIHKIALT